MPRYDVPKAAPEPLRIVQRFVNTSDHEHDREWLAHPADLERWLREAGLPVGERVTERDLERALALREALRRLLIGNNDGTRPDAEAVAALNGAAQAGGVALELDERGDPRLGVHGRGLDAALGRIVAVTFTAMLDGTWRRLKACRNCHWSFYDYSRNRAASWCSMSICGNRLKTRRYRRRKARTR